MTVRLMTAGYIVIREDGNCTTNAPPERCSGKQHVHAESARLKPLRVKEEVVRDVFQSKIVFGGHYSFHITSLLPLAEDQLIQQTLTVEELLRTFKVTDVSEWAMVEVTSMQWNISPRMIADGKHVGYFVDCIELKLRPSWKNPSVSCRHAPKTQEAKIEETKMLQEEKNGSIQLSFSKAFGATVGGGIKKTKGIEQKVVKIPSQEQWLVSGDDDDGALGAYYKWEMHYWQNEETGLPSPHRGTSSLLPPVPPISMLANAATVDWMWPSPTTDCTNPGTNSHN